MAASGIHRKEEEEQVKKKEKESKSQSNSISRAMKEIDDYILKDS